MRQDPAVPRPPFAPIFAAVLVCGVLATAVLAAQQAAPERFDNEVRADMFAGMAGDAAALDRAMKLCEVTLASDPDNAEALVWHGAGLSFQASIAFRNGDYAKGGPMVGRAFREMDTAVAKKPDSLGVLIPRGATLIEYARHDPSPDRARAELEKGLGDYEKVLALQKADWANRPLHARGELLSGLADGWLRDGDAAKARLYAQRIVTDLPGSAYATRAQDFLGAAPPPKQVEWHCMGCHVSSPPQ